jgi:hypothetical protein
MHDQDTMNLIRALYGLPVSVQITPRGSVFLWQCLDGSGSADNLPSAVSESLTYLITQLAGDSGVLDDLRGSSAANGA